MVTEYIELNQLDVMNWYEFHPSQEIMISDLKVIIIYYCLIFLYYGKRKKKIKIKEWVRKHLNWIDGTTTT